MKTNFLLHFIFGSHSSLRKDCANKFVSMKSNRVWKYTAALFICMLISVANAWGTEIPYKSAIFSAANCTSVGAYDGTITCTISDDRWTAVNAMNNNDNWDYIRMGPKKVNADDPDREVTTTITTGSAYSEAITKVVITGSKLRGTFTTKLIYASNADYSSDVVEIDGPAEFTDGKITINIESPVAERYYQLQIVCTNRSSSSGTNGVIDISQIDYYYESGITYYSVTYNSNGGSGTMIDSDSPYEENTIVPIIANEFTAPCGCFFAEWNTKADGSGKSYLPSESFTITQDTVLYAQWQVANYGGDVFTRISSVGDLNDGDEIIFVNQAETYACGMQQNANNRTPVPISTSEHSYTFDRRDLVQVFTVRKNSTQYGFHTGCGYIYSASSSANILKTNTTDVSTAPEGTSAWAVSVSDGVFTITNVTNGDYILQFNGTSYFSQYTGKQISPYIYKRTTPASYTVTWKVNGQNYTTGTPTTETNTATGITALPTPPADNSLSCASTFVGWSESELTGTGHSAPADLFTTSGTAPTINEDKTFHAVFVNPKTADRTLSITISNFTEITTDYEKTYTHTYSVDSIETTGKVKVEAYGVYKNASGIQMNLGKSTYIKNLYALPGPIKQIKMTWTATGRNSPTLYANTSSVASTGSTSLGKQSSEETTQTIDVNVASGYRYFYFDGTTVTGACYMSELKITYVDTLPSQASHMTYCTYTYTDANNDHLWSTAANWSSRSVPTINDRATITKPVTVDVATAKAKDIILDRSGGNTGSLTIGANKALEVAEKVRVWHGSAYGTTTESDLLIESSASGNGTLIFENNENQATVQMYCRANSTASPNPTWQYIGTPFIGSIPLYNYYSGYMYKWGNGWGSVDGDDEMEPFVGYSVSYPGEGHIFTMEGELVSTLQTRVITVESHKNKVVANSWTAPIQIKQLREADFVNLNRSVYFYNTGYTPAGTADVTANPTGDARYAAGTYISLPIHAAKYTSSDSVISSMQGFYVKNATESEGTLTLNYAQHVVPAGSTSIVNGAMHAPKRVQEDEEPVVAKILASGTNYDALLVLLERGDFSFGYDDGWDGDLMGNNTAAPRIYTRTETGTRDVVSAVPDFEGMTIYFRAGTDDNKYTFHFTYDENEEPLYLVDTDTNEYKRVLTGNSYTFYTSDNLAYGRFYLTYRAPSVTTDIDTNGANESTMKAIKYIENDNLYILRGGVIYDATGRRANNSTNH